jgi:hypothetical protein
MATSSWSSGYLHDTDANFRIWGNELSTKLQAIGGLTKTTDTGQINWVTVVRAAINTDAGYEVYYLNDSRHATAPIYIKIYYGTGTVATNPRMRYEVGTATNGAGVLSGTGSGTVYSFTTTATAGSATAANSYLCVTGGFFGLLWKVTGSVGWLIIQRTCDGTGAIDSKGAHICFRNVTTASYWSLRYEATAAVTSVVADGFLGLVPGSPASSSLQNGDKQIFLHWGYFPDMRPLWGTGVYVVSEFTVYSTLSVALVGASAHTYICAITASYANANAAAYGLCMIWE